jgi:hypothetical protein
MKGLENISSSLFEKIRSRFPKVVMGDETGAPTTDESKARFFDFDYVIEGESQGAISISIKDPNELKVYYSQNMLENAPEMIENEWYSFLKELRFFAKKHLMSFDARDIAKNNLDKRDYKYLAMKENVKVQESNMYGTTKSSYENLDKTRLIIRHKKEINAEQMGARARHIQSLFIENETGERFKYPYNHLAGARAMARHVANGGLPHDDFGRHIIETSGNIAKLTAFKRYVQNKDFMNSTSNDIIEGSSIELENLRSHIKKLQSQQYYKECSENFITPEINTDLDENIVNDLTSAFTLHNFNDDLKEMFPLLHNIQQKRSEINLESIGRISTDPVLDKIIAKYPEEIKAIANGDSPIDFDQFYDEVFGYFMDSGDMPYGVMKARDGDPDVWIADELERLGYLKNKEESIKSITPEEEFEDWADTVVDETTDKAKIALLNKLVGKHFAVGPDATNAIESLKGIIDDEGFVNSLKMLAKKDPDSCARPLIYNYIKNNDPESLDNLNFGDMKMEDDTTDVTIDKDGAMKLTGDDKEPKDEKASTEDIIEFVRSFYDKETGAFPRGETGVVISARKRFGDSVGDLVEKFVSKLTGKKVELADDDSEVEEGFMPKEIDGETEFEFTGDDGETGFGTLYYKAVIKQSDEHGYYAEVDPKSLRGESEYEGNAKVDDEYATYVIQPGGAEHEAAMDAAMDDAMDQIKNADTKSYEYAERDNKGFSDKEIKMAFGVLNDKRFKGGNYSGAVATIEKIAKGLSDHPSVANALKRTNEDLDYIKSKLAKLIK